MALALLAVSDGHEGHDEQKAEVEEAALAVGKAAVFVANAGEIVAAAAVGGECAG